LKKKQKALSEIMKATLEGAKKGAKSVSLSEEVVKKAGAGITNGLKAGTNVGKAIPKLRVQTEVTGIVLGGVSGAAKGLGTYMVKKPYKVTHEAMRYGATKRADFNSQNAKTKNVSINNANSQKKKNKGPRR